MEKPQLINFIAKVMEESGFKVYKNFKTSQYVIDIYAVLPTNFGDFGVVVECNNFDKDFPVSIETLKHMETVAERIKASKIVIVSSSFFTEQATNYALKKNIKLVDRNDLLSLAKRHQDKQIENQEEDEDDGYYYDDSYHDNYNDPYYEPYYDDYEYEEYNYDEGYGYDEYEYDYDDYINTQRQNNPVVYQPSLYRYNYDDYEDTNGFGYRISQFLENILARRNQNTSSNSLGRYYNQTPQSSFDNIRPVLGNPIILVALVVIITYLISFIGGAILKIDHILISSLQIFLALVLAYGFTFLFSERSRNFIIRGSLVFFISLIILIILILI
ncbi:MAG: restriction endonuclease [Methanobrevibacter sp.]|uniref:restriction endonuclease n=1 Tax=Methanobrevibacter sp. TaxID=66852 RepID=UPI0026E063EE|nr:restriction endonuclease [Methanobrevibacter sp.]MDO5847932.1 restriction endonuclease [Methanobrevibacter sp.]